MYFTPTSNICLEPLDRILVPNTGILRQWLYSRMEYKTFSCYDNFLPCNQSGVPSHTSTNNGLTHLKRLISGISNRLRTMTQDEFKNAYDLSRKAIVNENSVSFNFT